MRDIPFIESELSRCNKCGYCMQSCPVYRVSRRETAAPRGRNHVLRGIVQGNEIPKEALQPFFECLLCGACTSDCFGGVETKELMARAREAYNAEYGQHALLRYIFRNLLPNPERMLPIMRLLSLGKRSGISEIARSLGLLRWLSPALDAAEGLVETMPRRFLRDRLASMGFVRVDKGGVDLLVSEPDRATGPSVLYFIGCGTNFQLPAIGEAGIRLFQSAGCRVIVASNNCCGLPAWSYGDIDAAESLATRNIALLSGIDFDFMVSECGSCSGFLKKYRDLLPDDASARSTAERTLDATELLAQLKLQKPTHSGTTITYHDPCHLGRGQKVTEAPRRLLVDAGGYQLHELSEAKWCCGGAGSYNLAHPAISREILARKVDRIEQTGAEAVATACPACILQLQSGMLRTAGRPLPVRHVFECLAESQGISVDR